MSITGGSFAFGGAISSARFHSGFTRGRIQGGYPQAVAYPSPFFDVAHTYLPTTVKQLFQFCRYYYLTNPIVNAVVQKLSEYPVTDLVIDHEDPRVVERWKEFFYENIRVRPFQVECGLDYNCFHGDVKAITEEGVFRLRDLVGKTLRVLSQDGVYRTANFVESLTEQELLEVEFSDGSTVLTTAEHQWPTLTSSGNIKKVPTTGLEGRFVPRNVAPRPEQNEEFYEGVRHGFVFGDGTLYNDGKQARACFCGSKDLQMLKYFEGHGSPPYKEARGHTLIHGLPPHYKALPANGASASYWYGFLCGFLAADGSVDVAGCTVLTQRSKATLEAIAAQLPRIGMIAGRVRGYHETTAYGEGVTYILSLFKQYMLPCDFLLAHHRSNFEDNSKDANYGKRLLVREVRKTGIFEKVFCCMENETNTFTIDNGVLTGNTYGNCAVSMSFPFQKYLTCTSCGFSEQARKIRNNWTYTSSEFRLSCPKCHHTGAATPKDWYYRDASGIRPIRWNVEDIEVTYNQITGEYTYFFTIPAPLRADITLGKKDVVEGMPQIFLQAIRQQKGVVFSKSNFFHLKRATIAWHDRGWGIPLLLPVLKDAFYLQVMKKAQEAILLEHIVPLRVLFPQAASGTSDPFTTINLTEWRDQVAQEIARWRFDHNYIPIMPLPLGNQTIGGDGKALMLQGEMQQLGEQIIMGMGTPLEFLKGGLSYAGTNVSMRMLENGFISYIGRQRQLVTWMMKLTAHFMGWPEVGIRFKPFKMADDLQRKSYLFQLNQAQKISDTTLLADADLEIKEENEIMMRESAERIQATRKSQLAMAEIQGESQVIMMKFQQKAQQAMMEAQQAPAAPGEPGGPEGQMGPGQAQAQAQIGGQGGGAPEAPLGPSPAVLPPSPGETMSSSVPAEAQSLLGGEKKQPGVDVIQMAEAYAAQIAEMPPVQQQQALMALEAQSAELAGLVQQFLQLIQGGEAGQQSVETGVDQRPLPEQLPARRRAQLV